MTPRTRSGKNDGAESRVYRSKTVPRQAYFPHKRRTVRRPSPSGQSRDDKRQMVFLPEKMKEKNTVTVKDSDDDGEDEDMEELNTNQITKGESKKRGRDTLQVEGDEENEVIKPARKTRRKYVPQRQKRQREQIKVEPADEHGQEPSDLEDAARFRRVRQSTMTQLVDGQRPMAVNEAEEPKFRPVKRSSRLFWGGKRGGKAMDNKQRTLTQMVPGMRPVEVMSDDDMEEALGDLEAQDRNSHEYDGRVAQRLAKQGLHRVQNHDTGVTVVTNVSEEVVQSIADDNDLDESGDEPLTSNPKTMGLKEEQSYQPTQYIDAPTTRTRMTSRRQKNISDPRLHATETQLTKSSKAIKPRFGFLSTPEKQRVREIPSSQSPTESPLLTQPFSPHRSPLKECSGNADSVLQTPSKRKKVAFEEVSKEPDVPRTLKRFQSTIQDSEDEGWDDLEENETPSRHIISVQAPLPPSSSESHSRGKVVGAETQAILEQIDQACAHMDEEKSSSKMELQNQLPGSNNIIDSQSCHEVHPSIEEEPSHDHFSANILPVDATSLSEGHQGVTRAIENDEIEPVQLEDVHSTPPRTEVFPQDTLPSTPMVLQEESSDEDEEEPSPVSLPTSKELSPGLIGNDVQQPPELSTETIQCPRSPSSHNETQQSHSSKAEQQLQNEWFSYSQYANARPPQSSSMYATHDPFSHVATPAVLHQDGHSLQPSEYQRSQATTLDEVTPRKNRTRRLSSANVTPHRDMRSHASLISPSKLPSLYIPSSFPSPMEANLDGCSSPVLQETQAGVGYAGHLSWDDFSIPLPPPPEESEEPL